MGVILLHADYGSSRSILGESWLGGISFYAWANSNVPLMMMRGCTSITASSSSIETAPGVLVPEVMRYMSSMRLTFEIREDSPEKIYPPILEVCPMPPASSPSTLLKPSAKMLRQFMPCRFAFQNHEKGVLSFLHRLSLLGIGVPS